MMKFDLLDALELVKKAIGANSELIVSDYNGIGVKTTITVYIDGRYLSNSFIIQYSDMSDAYVNVMNLKFQTALMELQEKLGEI